MAMTVAEGSYAARVGVDRLRMPCEEGEDRDQRRTVLSREQDKNVSEEGQSARVVTEAVCPLK